MPTIAHFDVAADDRERAGGWGYLAVCPGTEGNSFGLWEENKHVE